MVRFRRATITTPAQANVVNIRWGDNSEYDRTQKDTDLEGEPVKMRSQGSGSFELLGGAAPANRYGQTMVAVVEDVSVGSGTETITNRTFTFTKVTFKVSGQSANDAQRGGQTVEFEYGSVSEA